MPGAIAANGLSLVFACHCHSISVLRNLFSPLLFFAQLITRTHIHTHTQRRTRTENSIYLWSIYLVLFHLMPFSYLFAGFLSALDIPKYTLYTIEMGIVFSEKSSSILEYVLFVVLINGNFIISD